MAFDSLDKLLQIILAQPQCQRQKRFYELKQCWYEIVNHKVAQHTRPVSLKNEILYVATANAVWAQELSLQRRNLRRKINRRLDMPINDLHFASMKWHGNLSPIDEEDGAETIHPSAIAFSDNIMSDKAKSETPQQALEQWFEQIKNRSKNWHTCPQCQNLCPEGELKRWQMCAICFRDSR